MKDEPPLRSALRAASMSDATVEQHLRDMAAGREPYRRFACMSPLIRSVWLAAADIIASARAARGR